VSGLCAGDRRPEGKVALISGAARGMGASVVQGGMLLRICAPRRSRRPAGSRRRHAHAATGEVVAGWYISHYQVSRLE
jgi:hypothetical protein